MKEKIRLLIFAGVTALTMGLGVVSSTAFAVVVSEANCLEGGCLRNGWTVYDYQSRQTAVVQCRHGNCEQFGWTYKMMGSGQGQSTVCRSGGCFAEGWDAYDLQTQQFQGTSLCLAGTIPGDNCLSAGWVERPLYGGPTSVYCQSNSCRQYGWQVNFPNGWQQISCLPGGCFERGWVVEQR